MTSTKGKLEFFFDCSSPWTYLAFKEIENLCSRLNLQLVWRPILVGGIFNTINPSVYESGAIPSRLKLHTLKRTLMIGVLLEALR